MKALRHIASNLRCKSKNYSRKLKGDIGLKSKTSTYTFSDAKNSNCEISRDLKWSVLQFHVNLYHELRAEHSIDIPK